MMSFQTAKDIREIKFRSLHKPFNNTDYYNCEDVDDYLDCWLSSSTCLSALSSITWTARSSLKRTKLGR